MVPQPDIDGARAAHRRLLKELEALDDATARRPSRLPGWTVGHVLTHLARNADSHVRMLEGAGRNEVADQYAGGVEQRADDIAAGAGRSAADLVDDVSSTCRRLEGTWAATSERTWRDGIGRPTGTDGRPVRGLPFARWRETEVHHADLGLGFGFEDWSEGFVDPELERAVEGLGERLASGASVRLEATDTGSVWSVPAASHGDTVVAAPRRTLLAWLLGRHEPPDAPPLAPWQREHRV